jgi:hypothetical protein
MLPSQEVVSIFFQQFSREMKDMGLFILDDFKEAWPDLPSEDEIRDQQVEDQSSDEDSDADY